MGKDEGCELVVGKVKVMGEAVSDNIVVAGDMFGM
jgi:hypothetical protein